MTRAAAASFRLGRSRRVHPARSPQQITRSARALPVRRLRDRPGPLRAPPQRSPRPDPRLVFDLILYLVQHRDRPVTKAELFEHVWPGRTVTEASLTQTITAARRALDDTPDAQRIIRTVHGRGYWWVAETAVVGPRTAEDMRDPLVGREGSLEVALGELDRVRRGIASAIRIIGEAGIGKTRFASEVAAVARGSGFTVLVGSCAETDGETTHSPWHDILRDAPGSQRSPSHRGAEGPCLAWIFLSTCRRSFENACDRVQLDRIRRSPPS